MRIKIDVVNDFPNESTLAGDFDLLINGFNDCTKIKYGSELKGETNHLKRISDLSKKSGKSFDGRLKLENGEAKFDFSQ